MMNERIKELIAQASSWVDVDCAFGTHPEYQLDAEKFAQLIINECAQRCEDIAIKHQIEETIYAAGKKAGAFECAVDLKQYFGVEE